MTTKEKPSKKDLWFPLHGPQAWITPSVMMIRRTANELIGGFHAELMFVEVMIVSKIAAYGRDCQFAAGEQFLFILAKRYQRLALARRLLASKYSDWGVAQSQKGNWLEGLKLLSRSLMYVPIRLRTYSRWFDHSCLSE